MDAEELSKKFADSLLPVTVFYGVIGGFGIISNAYVFYVYKYNYSRCNFRIFVLCLALVDFLSCLFVFPSEIYGHRIWFSYPISAAWFCKAKTVVAGVDVYMSSLVLLLIAVDRFKKVCRPHGKQIKTRIALLLCLLVFGIVLIGMIPVPFLFGIQTSNITYDGESFEVASCLREDQYKHSTSMTIYVALAYYLPVIASMIITMVLYAVLIRKIFSGSFLKFEKMPRRKFIEPVDNEQSATPPDAVAGSGTEMNHDSDEDNNEISDVENIELQSIDKQVIIKETEPNEDTCTKIQVTENRGEDIITAVDVDKPGGGKAISEKKLTWNNENSDNNTTEIRSFKHVTRKIEDMATEKKEKSQKINPNPTTIEVIYFDDQNITRPRVQGKGQSSENRIKDVIEECKKDTSNTNALNTLELNELKSLHKQNSNSLPMANTSPPKRTFGREAFKKLNNQKAARIRNIKTRSLIMFVVTFIFTVTTTIYFCTVAVVHFRENILDIISPDFAALFFLCWRIYFINHVINPFVYGFLDPRFRKAMKRSSQNLYRRISNFRLSSVRLSIHL